MMKMDIKKALRYGLILSLLLTFFTTAPGRAAPATQDTVLMITSPTGSSTVSGEVTIEGTATHPNFASYGVLYAAGPTPTADSQWVPITFGVQTMVVNGTLATWDTTVEGVPNGQYTLALAVYEQGDTEPQLHFVNNITVNNEEATPTPTATPDTDEEPTAQPTEAQPGEGEGAAPVGPTVVQPPTPTPRAMPTVAPDEEEATAEEEEGGLFDTANLFSIESIKETFCAGAWLAVLIYTVGLLYVIAKAVIRYYLRQRGKQAP
jgi:hypothetical protein